MDRLHTWPTALPEGLADLPGRVAAILGAEAIPLTALDTATTDPADALMAIVDTVATSDIGGVVADLEAAATAGVTVVVVVGDGYLGTERTDLAGVPAAAAAVATVRSLAARTGGTGRANVVAVSDTLLGHETTQKGPLAHVIDVTDVAEAVAFLLGEGGGYLTGQVLFVDGGRHIFSSMSA